MTNSASQRPEHIKQLWSV